MSVSVGSMSGGGLGLIGGSEPIVHPPRLTLLYDSGLVDVGWSVPGQSMDFTHNIGSIPDMVIAFYECKEADHTWLPGERFHLAPYADSDGGRLRYIRKDENVIYWHSAQNFVTTLLPTPASLAFPTASKWGVRVQAYWYQ